MADPVACPNCGFIFPTGARYCPVCGGERPEVINREAATRRACPHCGVAAQPDWVICPNCGKSLKGRFGSVPTWGWISLAVLGLALAAAGALLLGPAILRELTGLGAPQSPPVAVAPLPSPTAGPAPTRLPTEIVQPSPAASNPPPSATPSPRPTRVPTITRTPIQFIASTGQSGGIGQGSSRAKTQAARLAPASTQAPTPTQVPRPKATTGLFPSASAPTLAYSTGGGNLSTSSSLCVSYYNRSQGDLYFTCRTSFGRWEAPSPRAIDTQGNVGLYTSLAFDSLRQPWISYYDETNGDLKIATEREGRWQIEVVDSEGDTGKYPALAIGPDDLPAIAYYDASRNMLRLARLTTGGWTLQDVEPVGNMSGDYRVSLVIDRSGNLSLAYQNNLDKKLRYTRLENGAFTTEIVEQEPNLAQFTSMAIYPDGRTGISYYGQGSRHLKYVVGGWGAWQAIWVNYGYGDESGKYNSLAVSAKGIPYIAYFYEHKDYLELAAFNGSNWESKALETYNHVGQYTSLAINQQGQAAIAYYYIGGKMLRVAVGQTDQWYLSDSWKLEDVDVAWDTGLYTSIQYR